MSEGSNYYVIYLFVLFACFFFSEKFQVVIIEKREMLFMLLKMVLANFRGD